MFVLFVMGGHCGHRLWSRWTLAFVLDFLVGLEKDGVDVFCTVFGSGKESTVKRGNEMEIVSLVGVVMLIVA